MIDRGITFENLLRTFPESLRADDSMRALASAIAEVLAERAGEVDRIRIYPLVDSQPEQLLDILAKDFKVDWYGYNYPLYVKRAQFRDSFRVRRKLGTAGAMEVALRNLYPGTDVEEWFDYGGDPYYFRVIVDVTNQKVPISHTDGIIRTIVMFKNKRSHLQDDTVIYCSRIPIALEVTTGYVIYNVRVCGTYPVRATQGGISDPEIIVVTGADGLNYSVPMTGQIEAGIHPDTATQGIILKDEVILLATAKGVDYCVPTTGTKPDTATQGGNRKSGVEVGDTGEGAAYSVRFCGTSPGGLM